MSFCRPDSTGALLTRAVRSLWPASCRTSEATPISEYSAASDSTVSSAPSLPPFAAGLLNCRFRPAQVQSPPPPPASLAALGYTRVGHSSESGRSSLVAQIHSPTPSSDSLGAGPGQATVLSGAAGAESKEASSCEFGENGIEIGVSPAKHSANY